MFYTYPSCPCICIYIPGNKKREVKSPTTNHPLTTTASVYFQSLFICTYFIIHNPSPSYPIPSHPRYPMHSPTDPTRYLSTFVPARRMGDIKNKGKQDRKEILTKEKKIHAELGREGAFFSGVSIYACIDARYICQLFVLSFDHFCPVGSF